MQEKWMLIRERQLDSDTTESTADILKPPSTAELESDTTESIPDILKSPQSDIVIPVIPSDSLVREEESEILASPAKRKTLARTMRGVKKVTVLETQLAESEADSDDDIAVVRLLRPTTKTSLTAEQIADCQEGPIGFNPLRVIRGRDKEGKFSFCKNVDVPKNHLSLEYLLYVYDVPQSTFKRLRARGGEALAKQVPHNKGQCVLLDETFASTLYTARFFYVEQSMKKWKRDNVQATTNRKTKQRKNFRKQWDIEKEKDPQFGAEFEKKSRDHAARAKGAKEELVDTLNRNARRSYSSLEKAINN
jgi:hypothetical protein